VDESAVARLTVRSDVEGTVDSVHNSSINITELCILYAVHLRVSFNSQNKQWLLTYPLTYWSFVMGDALGLMWDRNLNFEYYLHEVRAWKSYDRRKLFQFVSACVSVYRLSSNLYLLLDMTFMKYLWCYMLLGCLYIFSLTFTHRKFCNFPEKGAVLRVWKFSVKWTFFNSTSMNSCIVIWLWK